MPEYQIIIKDGSDNIIGELRNFTSLVFSKIMNNFGSCKFAIPVTNPDLSSFIGLRRFETHIFRDGTLIWAGEQALIENSLKADSPNLLKVTSFGWFEQLFGRLTSEKYDGIDAGEIAWDAIDTSQNETDGDIGITEGTIEATQNRDRNYSDDNIAVEIQRLTSVINGFDMEITDSKVFNVYEFQGLDKSNQIVFEYGTNIEEVSKLVQDFSIITNQTVVRGEGMGTEQARVTRTDTDARSIYGLRQRLITESNISETTSLNEKGDAINNKRKQPVLEIAFKQEAGTLPTFGSISMGDLVQVKIQHGIHNINNQFRVFGWEVSFDSKGKETIEYFLGL